MATKFTYDTANKVFLLNAGVTTLDAKTEFYSWVKHDWLTTDALNKFRFPIQSIGGQDLGGGVSISPYYSLQDGWRIQFAAVDQSVIVTGNIITAEGTTPFIENPGAYHHTVQFTVSANSLTTTVEGGVPPWNALESAVNATPQQVWELANGIESGFTPQQAMRIMLSALAGLVTGAETQAPVFRDVNDTKDRITATTDVDGNRTAIVLDPD